MTELTLGRVVDFKSTIKLGLELIKVRLSMLVASSCVFGYLLAMGGNVKWVNILAIALGSVCISGSAVLVNQILERKYDKLMKRTRSRPLPTQRVTVPAAWKYAIALLAMGLLILFGVSNMLTVMLSVISFILYAFVYTPLKRVGSIAVLVGAIPGAFPPLLGWVAASGQITHEALVIFGIQFIWQFPHFWAIAWVADEDYKRAGFKLLPAGGRKDVATAIQIMIYTLFLIPLGLLPAKFGISGINSAIIATLCGVVFLAQTFSLMKNCLEDNSEQAEKSARWIMFGSFLYLPIVQIAYLLYKI